MIASLLDARIVAQLPQESLEVRLQPQSIDVRRQAVRALQTKGELLCDVLRAGSREEQARAWLVHLPSRPSETAPAAPARLLAVGAEDHAVGDAQGSDQRHRVTSSMSAESMNAASSRATAMFRSRA